MKNKYKSSDFNLIAALACKGHIILDVVGDTKKTFVLDDTDKLQEDVQSYYRREMRVDPVDFFNESKLLKNRLYQ